MKIKQEIKDINIVKKDNKYYIERLIVQELTPIEFVQFKKTTGSNVVMWDNMTKRYKAQVELTPKIEDQEIAKLTEKHLLALKNAQTMQAVEEAKEKLEDAEVNYVIHKSYEDALKKFKE